ncbi:MAG: VTC domain-containing protein [Candidatus Latescibacterota bacterium]|jgi:hypothetical protein|tara:strand:- start:918 stop:1733 length:816 start_codon:yes stop_codon:yes gene_type:complete
MKRLEYKYKVPIALLPSLREQLDAFMVRDKYVREDTGQYTIRSIYMDTYALDYYYQKESGIQHRRKLRVRAYNEWCEDAQAFLEIKRKDDMSVAKARAPFSFADIGALFASGDIERYIRATHPRALSDARAFFFHIHRYALKPVVLVCYEREAFGERADSSLRITLDKDLRSAPFPHLGELFSEEKMQSSLRGHFILEVKFYKSSISGWLKSFLEKHRLERMALSKYAISLESHHIPQRARTFSTWARSQTIHRNAPGRRKSLAVHTSAAD